MTSQPPQSAAEIEALTIRQLFNSLRPKHVLSVVSLLASVLALSFAAGLNWESREHRAELGDITTQLKAATAEKITASVEKNRLESELRKLRAKESFLELTATLQLQALLRPNSREILFNRDLDYFVMDNSDVSSYRSRYAKLVDNLTQPINGEDPVADVRSPRVGPEMLVFRRDNTSWILFDGR